MLLCGTYGLFRQTAAVKRVVGRGEAIIAVLAIWAGTARRKVPPPSSHSIVHSIDDAARRRRRRHSGRLTCHGSFGCFEFYLPQICRKNIKKEKSFAVCKTIKPNI